MSRVATIHYKRRSLPILCSVTRQEEGKTTKYVDCRFTQNCKICTHVNSIHKPEVSNSVKVDFYFEQLGYELEPGRNLIIHLHLMPVLKKDRVTLLIPPYAFREYRLHYTWTFSVVFFKS